MWIITWNSMEEHAMWHAIDLFSHSLRTCWKLHPTASQKAVTKAKASTFYSDRSKHLMNSACALRVYLYRLWPWATSPMRDEKWPKCSKYSITQYHLWHQKNTRYKVWITRALVHNGNDMSWHVACCIKPSCWSCHSGSHLSPQENASTTRSW